MPPTRTKPTGASNVPTTRSALYTSTPKLAPSIPTTGTASCDSTNPGAPSVVLEVTTAGSKVSVSTNPTALAKLSDHNDSTTKNMDTAIVLATGNASSELASTVTDSSTNMYSTNLCKNWSCHECDHENSTAVAWCDKCKHFTINCMDCFSY